MSRAALVAGALAAASCTWTFDAQAPDLPFLNAEPDTASLPKLNRAPAGTARIMYGSDFTPWAVFSEVMPGDFTPQKGLRLVHLTTPFQEQTFLHKKYFSTWGTFYIFDRDPPDAPNPMTHVSLVSPGELAPDAQYDFPGGPYIVVADDLDTRFLYFVQSAASTEYFLQVRDGSFHRTFLIPEGVDPADPLGAGSYRYNYDGGLLFVHDGKGKLVVHSTTEIKDWDLGKRPPLYLYDDASRRVITCGPDGVRTVPLDGGDDKVLEPAPCDEGGSIDFRKNGLMYTVGGALRFVPLDGSAAPVELLQADLRFITFTPTDDRIIYSTVPSGAYVNDAGDAWLGSWRFMQRGLDLSFSRDHKKLRWLENAATPSGVGDLVVAPIGGAPAYLSRNVRQYQELKDGRILAATNHAFRGTHNRVVLIDEQGRTQQWVASSASEYVGIPGTKDLLIDVVTGPSTFDIVRVPLPPKP